MKPLSLVARTICDLFAWFLIIFGVYVIIHGDMTPGGGFQGGAVVASFMALLLVAHGGDAVMSWVKQPIYEFMLLLGLLMFIGLAFAGIPYGSFFYNFLSVPHEVAKTMTQGLIPFSGNIGLMDIAVGIEVAGGLSLMLILMFRGIQVNDFADSRKETGHDD